MARKDFRVDVLIKTKFKPILISKDTIVEYGQFIIGNITNLSATGIKAISEKELQIGTKIRFTLKVEGYDSFVLDGEIKRKEKDDNNFIYGIQFINMDDKKETRIRKILFDKQLEEKGKK